MLSVVAGWVCRSALGVALGDEKGEVVVVHPGFLFCCWGGDVEVGRVQPPEGVGQRVGGSGAGVGLHLPCLWVSAGANVRQGVDQRYETVDDGLRVFRVGFAE